MPVRKNQKNTDKIVALIRKCCHWLCGYWS